LFCVNYLSNFIEDKEKKVNATLKLFIAVILGIMILGFSHLPSYAQSAPTVSGITPGSGVRGTTVNITDLAGTDFAEGATVKLTRSGRPDIIAASVVVASSAQITCTFHLTGATAGQWNVVVTNPDAQSGTLTNGFTVTRYYSSLDGDWMFTVRGAHNDRGAAAFTFAGSEISGAGFLFSLGDAFLIGEGAELTIDDSTRKIEGSLSLTDSSGTALGKITISRGTFNRKYTKITLRGTFDGEGTTPPTSISFTGHRYDPADPDLEIPEGFTNNATIRGSGITDGHPISIILEPSPLGGRFGILSGGGTIAYNTVPFPLEISSSLFFVTDTGKIYGEFKSNLFSEVMRGSITPTKTGPRFLFQPLLTIYANRASIKGVAEQTLPVPPTLVSPANAATTVPINPTTFTWTAPEEDVTYALQVSTSSSFGSTVVKQTGLTGTSYNASNLANNTSYYWRMNSTKAGLTSDWSTVWSFTTVVATPAAPALASPENNATGVSTDPTLSWNASSGATSYMVEVATDPEFLNIAFQGGISGTSQPVSGLLNETLYYWRVNATNTGGTSDWSTVWNFTTVGP
jgi:hypothetical protein